MKKLTLAYLVGLSFFLWIVAPRGLPFPWPSPIDMADPPIPDDGELYELGLTYAGEVELE